MPKSTAAAKKVNAAKNRSVVPIPSTIERIKGFPDKLILFKIPASPFWWVRYHDKKPIKRSTKTESKQEAVRFAKKFYESVLVNNALGRSNNAKAKSFVICADALIREDQEKASRGELSEKYVASQKNLINKHVKAFFKSFELGDIQYADLDRFKTYLFERNLASTSVKIHFVAIQKIFNYGQKHNVIKVAPLMPDIKREDNPRGYLSLSEYAKLCRTVRQLVGQTAKIKSKADELTGQQEKTLRNIVITKEFQLLIGFMVYSFIRPTDLKQIKHKHIEIRKGDEGEYLWMPIPMSKRHDSPITSMPRAAIFYKQLRELAINEKLKLSKKSKSEVSIEEDYVFYAGYENRTYAYQQIYRQFELALQTAGMKTNRNGDVLTPYSLRHTSIMYRLIYGGEINTTKIAKNARTSTEIIERFYVAQLESSDVTKDLHKRKQPRQKREPKIFISQGHDADLNQMIEESLKDIPEHLRKKKITIT